MNIKIKLGAAFAAITFVLSLIVTSIIAFNSNTALELMLDQNQRSVTESFVNKTRQQIKEQDSIYLVQAINELLKTPDINEAFVLDKESLILGHSDSEKLLTKFGKDAIVSKILDDQEQNKTPKTAAKTVKGGFRELTFPVFADAEKGNKLIGILRVSFKPGKIEGKKNNNWIFAGALSLAAAIVALFAGISLSAVVLKPLGNITFGLDSIIKGDYDRKINSDRKDEFKKVYSLYNEMLDKMKDQLSKITQEAGEVSSTSSTGLNFIINAFSEAVVLTNSESVVTTANANAKKILGDDIEGKHLMELSQDPEFLNRLKESMSKPNTIVEGTAIIGPGSVTFDMVAQFSDKNEISSIIIIIKS